MRTYRPFDYREARLRVCCDRFDVVGAELVRQRQLLDAYLAAHPSFGESLVPVTPRAGAPEVAHRMAAAAARVGVGPMAAVAGAMAQLVAEAALRAGAREAIVDNGGDIFIAAEAPVTMALFAGSNPLVNRLAFRIDPGETPLAICSSSGRMGHSMSLGHCDLATVVSRDAALADAAATEAANRVSSADDLDRALARIAAIEGVDGVLLTQDDRIGIQGRLPRLVRVRDGDPAGLV